MDIWIQRAIVSILGAALLGCIGIVAYCQVHNLVVPTEIVSIASSISGGFLGVVTALRVVKTES